MKFCSRIAELGEQELKKNWIGRFIKKELQYCYKRGSSRSYLSMNSNLKYWQSIFTSRALRDLFLGKVFINIDESSFIKSIKSNYSWLQTGESYPKVNVWGTVRAVVLFALISNGDWFWFVSKNTTDSKVIWNFITLLSKFIEQWMNFSVSDSELLLDNASIHLSAATRHFTKKLGMQMQFLPPYSPKLAPVEIVFGMLKNKLRAKKSQHVIRYSLISEEKKYVKHCQSSQRLKPPDYGRCLSTKQRRLSCHEEEMNLWCWAIKLKRRSSSMSKKEHRSKRF